MPGPEFRDGKLHYNWETIDLMSTNLADKIEASGEEFSRLLVLQRGGSFTANVLARRFGMEADAMLSASITRYTHGSEEGSTVFREGQFPVGAEVAGHNILVVDEVCDRGLTLEHATKRVHHLGAMTVRSAVLHYKPTKSENGFVPDFFVDETDKWVVYPWEKHEEHGKNSMVRIPGPHDGVTKL